MELPIRDRALDHRHHFLRGIRCLGAQIRSTAHPSLVNFPGSFLLRTRHRRSLQLHVLRHLHLVPRRLAARDPPLVRTLYIYRPYTDCDLRGLRCLHRRMAHTENGSSVDRGDRRSSDTCRPDHSSNNAGATILLASCVSSHSHSVVLPGLHLHRCRYHRKQ